MCFSSLLPRFFFSSSLVFSNHNLCLHGFLWVYLILDSFGFYVMWVYLSSNLGYIQPLFFQIIFQPHSLSLPSRDADDTAVGSFTIAPQVLQLCLFTVFSLFSLFSVFFLGLVVVVAGSLSPVSQDGHFLWLGEENLSPVKMWISSSVDLLSVKLLVEAF